MEVLPLKLIDDSDLTFLGLEIIDLGKLTRAGFPTLPGFVITPASIVLKTLLTHTQNTESAEFTQSLNILKSDLKKLPVPDELKKLDSAKNYFLNGKILKDQPQIWSELLNIWILDIESSLWRKGFTPNLNKDLSPQIIYEVPKNDKRLNSLKAFYVTSFLDSNDGDVKIESTVKLDPSLQKNIDSLVLKAEKTLYFPYFYHFILTDQLYLIHLKPYTEKIAGSNKEEMVLPPKRLENIKKSAIKIFWNLSVGFSTPDYLDGIIIESTKINDFDSLFFKLAETALSFPHKSIIFVLPENLLNDPKFCQKYLETLSYFIHNRNLLNIDICLSNVKSSHQTATLRSELAKHALSGNGVSKIILEFGIPENFINLQSYLNLNPKGLILNLDLLQKFLNGETSNQEIFDKTKTDSLLSFLKPYLKEIHQSNLSFIVSGEVIFKPEVLEFLIDSGVFGVVSNNLIEAHSLPDQLSFVEERVIRKRLD